MLFIVEDIIPITRPLVTVAPEASISEAWDLMIDREYSQLPVVDADNRTRGFAITEGAILRAVQNFRTLPENLLVRDVMVSAERVRFDTNLLDVLDEIQRESFVLVVDADDKLRAIVTTYDTTAHFQRYAEDIMLVEDIEATLKEFISTLYTEADLKQAISETALHTKELRRQLKRGVSVYLTKAGITGHSFDVAVVEAVIADFTADKPAKEFDRLTFQEYADILLQSPSCPKLQNARDVSEIRTLLEAVRDTRNQLAHFRGELTAPQRDQLRFCSEWLSRIVATNSPTLRGAAPNATEADTPSAQTLDLEAAEEPTSSTDSSYAAIATLLMSVPPNMERLSLKFSRIEQATGIFPRSARTHRSWWSNNPANPQGAEWLNAGFRAQSVNFSDEQVTFVRIAERGRAYIHFFNDMMTRLRGQEFPLKEMSPQGISWHSFADFRWKQAGSAVLNASFTRRKDLRIELYLDCGDAAQNKERFDLLFSVRRDIEGEMGAAALSWERMDGKRSARVAIYRPVDITGDLAAQEDAKVWAAEQLVTFWKVLSQVFEAWQDL